MYIFLSDAIAEAFFPLRDTMARQYLGTLVFSLGFLSRPVGGLLFGLLADKFGRRPALEWSLAAMGLATAMIVFCPTYATIGVAAPIGLVVARILQGMSIGGEIGVAMCYFVEHAPPKKRGLFGSLLQMTQGGVFFMIGLVSVIALSYFRDGNADENNWRICYSVGLLTLPVSYFLRLKGQESKVFLSEWRHRTEAFGIIRQLLSRHSRELLTAIGLISLWTVAIYSAAFTTSYVRTVLNMTRTESFMGMLLVGIVMLFCPMAGLLSDQFGRRRIMAIGAFGFVILAYPLFSMLDAAPGLPTLLLMQGSMATCLVFYAAPATAMLVELFPTRVRATAIALAYGISVAVLGGLTPLILDLLIGWTGSVTSIAFYLDIAASVSLVTLALMQDRTGLSLD